MFQQDKSRISCNFSWGFAESNIVWKWMAGAVLTFGCHVLWPYTIFFLLLGAQTVSTTVTRIAGIFWEDKSRCGYGCTYSTYTRIDWAWIQIWAPGYSRWLHWASSNY